MIFTLIMDMVRVVSYDVSYSKSLVLICRKCLLGAKLVFSSNKDMDIHDVQLVCKLVKGRNWSRKVVSRRKMCKITF